MSNPDQTAAADGVGYGSCLRCGAELEPIGTEAFRVGGTSGGWGLVFGQLADIGEGMLDLEVFACAACRKVELRVPAK